MVGPNEQGELQGALACIGSLTSIVAPLLLTNLFAYFTSGHAPVYFPGAAFLAASVCLVLAALVFTRIRRAIASAAASGIDRLEAGLVNAASQPFQFVFYSEFFFFERRDPDFIPIGMGHFGV